MPKATKKDELIEELEEQLDANAGAIEGLKYRIQREQQWSVIAAVLGGCFGAALVTFIMLFAYRNTVNIDKEWGDELLSVERDGVIYDTVPRVGIMATTHAMKRADGILEDRNFDIEYLDNHRSFHHGRLCDAERLVEHHKWRIDQVNHKIKKYKEMLEIPEPEKKEEKK